jgi:segregation and condensation protein B
MIQKNQKRLTRTALETLSIIAYKQPITKAEMEFIRGVNCDYAVQKLLDKQLVSIIGRSEAAGRPLLYGTSPFFMEYFGLADMSDLPKLKEFEVLAEEQMEDFRQKQTASDPTSQLTPTNGRQETSEEGT